LAICVLRRRRIRRAGALEITFIDAAQMRRLNRRSLGHDWTTDVLSFRYDGESVAGEILIAPAAARRYARAHGIPYREELARYVIHGILHWTGKDDRTAPQQRDMRAMENAMLAQCSR